MKREQTREDLEDHLAEQWSFLVTSCELFDQGNEAEAKRIAVVVRTLVHETPNSRALLDQLDLKSRLHFFAINYTYKPWNFVMFHGLVGLLLPPSGPRFVPHLDMLIPRLLTFDDWWAEPVMSTRGRGRRFTRKELVLALANKDGGAHVDPELDAAYTSLARDCNFGLTMAIGGKEQVWEQNPFLPSVRQIGHEVLRTLAGVPSLRARVAREADPAPGHAG